MTDPVENAELFDEDLSLAGPQTRKKQNVVLEQDYVVRAKFDQSREVVHLPGDFPVDSYSVVVNAPRVNYQGSTEAAEWAESWRIAIGNASFPAIKWQDFKVRETFVDTLEREGSDFGQFLEINKVKYGSRKPGHKLSAGSIISGSTAVQKASALALQGEPFTVFLWHTGIWVTFNPPKEAAIVALNHAITKDKIKQGRDSYGMAYSNSLTYTVDRVVNFALAHLHSTSLDMSKMEVNELKSVISVLDIPMLLSGVVMAMYPNGFQFKRACTGSPGQCFHVEEARLSLDKCTLVDRNAFTEWQKSFIPLREPGKRTLEQVERYKEELRSTQPSSVNMANIDMNIVFNLKTPTIQTFVNYGYAWIDGIVRRVESVAAADVSAREKNDLIARFVQTSAMMEYGHWVESIELDDHPVTDELSISETLEVLSGNDQLLGHFIKGVTDYINLATITVIGIETYKCDSCNKEQQEKAAFPRFVNVIPLDIIEVFFDLINYRMGKILAR